MVRKGVCYNIGIVDYGKILPHLNEMPRFFVTLLICSYEFTLPMGLIEIYPLTDIQ